MGGGCLVHFELLVDDFKRNTEKMLSVRLYVRVQPSPWSPSIPIISISTPLPPVVFGFRFSSLTVPYHRMVSALVRVPGGRSIPFEKLFVVNKKI